MSCSRVRITVQGRLKAIGYNVHTLSSVVVLLNRRLLDAVSFDHGEQNVSLDRDDQ